MYGCNPYGAGVGGIGHGGPGCHGRRRDSYNGSTFVLIVVLFILLIIVGSTFV